MGWRTEDGALNETREVRELSTDELTTVSRFGIHNLDIEADRHTRRNESGAEQCVACSGPIVLEELTESDDLALCIRHWNYWLVRFLHSEDAPGCNAHLIMEPDV